MSPAQQQRLIIKSYAEADRALQLIRARRQRVERVESRLNERRTQLDATLVEKTAEDLEQIHQAEAGLKKFALGKLPEFNPQRSRRLNHGVLEFHLVHKLMPSDGSTFADVKEALLAPVLERAMKFMEKLAGRYIRVRFDINKKAVYEDYRSGKLTPELLANLGMRMVPRDEFGYKLADTEAQPTD